MMQIELELKVVTPLTWPPPHCVKKSRRARHVRLKISQSGQLELVVPFRFNIDKIPGIIERKKPWIQKHLSLIQQHHQSTQPTTHPLFTSLPNQINLPAIHQQWKIIYEASHTTLQIIERPNQEIVIIGDINAHKKCNHLLKKWLKSQATKHLIPWLQRLSQQLQLPYHRVSIRRQTTRWGSCTKRKTITLNCKLLFLPPEVVNHILIHELCHTVHLDHSPRFWKLVEQFDPHWKEYRRLARDGRYSIPAWVDYPLN
jgi:predicted metal-dependent hydrolase